jgi:hypothetical protein
MELGHHLLQHKRVHVDHAVLQKREHAQLMILVPIARQLAAAGEKHEVVGSPDSADQKP